jgi:hypothetical protein
MKKSPVQLAVEKYLNDLAREKGVTPLSISPTEAYKNWYENAIARGQAVTNYVQEMYQDAFYTARIDMLAAEMGMDGKMNPDALINGARTRGLDLTHAELYKYSADIPYTEEYLESITDRDEVEMLVEAGGYISPAALEPPDPIDLGTADILTLSFPDNSYAVVDAENPDEIIVARSHDEMLEATDQMQTLLIEQANERRHNDLRY